MERNRVKFGLCNVHVWPIITDDSTGTTYGETIKVEGGVKISFKPEGSTNPFYADNVTYHNAVANNGYSGSLEIALILDEILTKILSQTEDTEDGTITETASDKNVAFAMAFQFEGDKKATRHIFYKCNASRPAIEGETIGDKTEPNTDTLDINVIPRISDQKIKTKVEQGKLAYDSFFEKPYEKAPTI